MFAVLLIGIFLVTIWFEAEENPAMQEINSPEDRVEEPQSPVKSFPAPAPQNTVAPDAAADLLPYVRYRNGAFLPARVVVKRIEEDGVECFLKVFNESDRPILLRLGPYEQGKEKGFRYSAIPAGDAAVLDPRYTGISDAVFYNTANPSEQFTVRIDASCN